MSQRKEISHKLRSFKEKSDLLLVEKKPQVAICWVKNSDQRWLLLRRSKDQTAAGMWDLPGGSREEKEEIWEAASRELFEETHLKAKKITPIANYTFTHSGKIETNSFVFLVEEFGNEIEINKEHDLFHWTNLAEIFEMIKWPEMQKSITQTILQTYPVFLSSGIIEPKSDTNPWERAVAVIKVKDSNQFVVYDRFDNLPRFPGGHVEIGEDWVEAAIRETQEEVGISEIKKQRYLGSCNKFYNRKGSIVHTLEHFYFFEIDVQNWEDKIPDETGMRSFLATREEILKTGWNQMEWILNKI